MQIEYPLIITELSELFFRSKERDGRRFNSHCSVDERWHAIEEE